MKDRQSLSLDTVAAWLRSQTSEHFILGYGSLMSHCSRSTHSGIQSPAVAAKVSGFQRGWVTRAHHENQTYVGAWVQANASLNAQLLPVQFDDDFAKREQDYEFVSIDIEQVDFVVDPDKTVLHGILASKTVWICRTLDHSPAEDGFPVNASYVATCIAGCLESGDTQQAHEFIQSTVHWPNRLHNDLHAPRYPRHAKLSAVIRDEVETLLREYQLIDD